MASGGRVPTPEVGSVERIEVGSRVVACDGGDGALGHPRVWLKIVERQIFCPYCSILYVLREGAGDDHGH
jgi:uncharacterized Zn-finger protein